MSDLFRVEGLTKNFGGLAVSRNISLAMPAGRAARAHRPERRRQDHLRQSGDGADSAERRAGRPQRRGCHRTSAPCGASARGLVRTFQVTRLFSQMTPEEHVTLTVLQREGKANRILSRFTGNSEVAGEVEGILSTLGLLDVARRKVGEIAYGQQRLLEIGIALALRPKVLLLDEPAAGVPSSDTPRIEQALERLPPSLAVLMIEHDMDLVFRFARRVVVLAAGEIIFEGLPSEVAANEKVREAYLGNYAHARRIA